MNKSDPYSVVRVGTLPPQGTWTQEQKKTQTIDNNLNPQWDAPDMAFALTEQDTCVEFEVMDSNMVSDATMGKALIDLGQQGMWHEMDQPLTIGTQETGTLQFSLIVSVQ